ncbi:ATP-binding protein [Streptomyces sp. H27-D2]|uniref:ATP-binding protein n=1 Tax=Streptomyces sp. H27-D2 TaxID=3046304 RepID=UPI002DB6C5B5|nr:ATP-binding protein [Streptomyces sp. H27-D2]MEC4018227.1 ATP-binding protein [Streptomyces sp. H27-D2]
MSAQTATRQQAEFPPVSRALLTLAVSALVTGGACLWAVSAAPGDERALVAYSAGTAALLLSVAVAVATYSTQAARRFRDRITLMDSDAARLADHTLPVVVQRLRDGAPVNTVLAEAPQPADAAHQRVLWALAHEVGLGTQAGLRYQERIALLESETALLADETLPAVVRRLRDGASASTALAEMPQPADAAHQRILSTMAQEVGAGERMRMAAMSACANAAGRVQALATSMLADLREMEDRHDESVLGDLLKLDHSTAQAGRLADSIAVLTGARSGRRWNKPIVMESILRGAVGRISAYQRVRIHSTSTAAVAGYAAEGIMHAFAELMDNATSFSPPSDEVHVYVEEVHAGVVVTVEDGGLVMGTAALLRAEAAVSSEPLDLTTLSGTRLGLAVVGCLARKHGLTVSFRPSSRGGTGVVVMIPRLLITQARQELAPVGSRTGETSLPAARTPQPARSGRSAAAPRPPADPYEATAPHETTDAAVTAATAAAVAASDTTAGGLPQRRRGQTLASSARPPASPGSTGPAEPPRPRPDAGARFGAFRQASRGKETGGEPDTAARPADSPTDAAPGSPSGTPSGSFGASLPDASADPHPGTPPEGDNR